MVRKGRGLRKVAKEMNEKYNLEGETRKMNKTTLARYHGNGMAGASPVKSGPKPHLPQDIFEILAVHVSMKQMEGVTEEKPRALKALIGAALMNTKFDGYSVDEVYRKFRQRYPHIVEPRQKIQMEERRGLWGTYKNLNTWFDGSKRLWYSMDMRRTSL